jgi:uncharacterized membrane protein YebE (DUF533 family)
MNKIPLPTNDKAFVIDELRKPLDVDAVARAAATPEEAASIYAACWPSTSITRPNAPMTRLPMMRHCRA